MATKSADFDDVRGVLISLLGAPLESANFELVDVEIEAFGTADGVVRVLVEHLVVKAGEPRIDLNEVALATKLIDELIEAHDPIEQAFTLEVSSPGLERPLRTPAHFARFRDAEIAVKTVAGTPGERRVQGRLDACDAELSGSIVVAGRTIAYSEIDRARTVFRWGEESLPTSSGEPRKKGTLPKGQRPVHPKALLTATKSGGEQPSDNVNEVLSVPHESTATPKSDAPAALAPPNKIPTEVTL